MRLLLTLSVLVLVSGCTYQVPRKYLPYPITNPSFNDPTTTVAIPLPVIASSPNEGITYGGLVAFLLHNSKDEVSSLVVPQINYNQYFGVTSTLYGAFYTSPDESMKITLSQATTINREYRFVYQNSELLSRRLLLDVNVYNYADGSARFFGFQSTSNRKDETNYTDAETGFTLSGGYRFGNLQVALGERFKDVDIQRGAVTKVPFISDVFPVQKVPGVGGYHIHAQKLSVIYNTLDSDSMPTSGKYARASIEGSASALGSGADFMGYEAEGKIYYPLSGGRFITVARLEFKQTQGKDIPFLEQSILGGENTLRGYGQNRFIDRSFLLLNLGERIRLFRWEIFHVDADWEMTPFIDLGSVMRSVFEATNKSFEFNPGLGLRAVVRPNIVGRIDIGLGRDGPAVFVGLNYPF